jgi:hypothetical protein
MLGKPPPGSAPLRGCYRKGLTPSSLRASALQAGMAETAIPALSNGAENRQEQRNTDSFGAHATSHPRFCNFLFRSGHNSPATEFLRWQRLA